MGRLSGNNEPGIAPKRVHRVVNCECIIEGVVVLYLFRVVIRSASIRRNYYLVILGVKS